MSHPEPADERGSVDAPPERTADLVTVPDIDLRLADEIGRSMFGLPELSMPRDVELFMLAASAETSVDPDMASDVARIQSNIHGIVEPLISVTPSDVSEVILGGSPRSRTAAAHVLAAEEYVDQVLAAAPGVIERTEQNAAEVEAEWQTRAQPPEALAGHNVTMTTTVDTLQRRLAALEAQAPMDEPNPTPESSNARLDAETETYAVKQWLWSAQNQLSLLRLGGTMADFEIASADTARVLWAATTRLSDAAQRRRQRARKRARLWHKFRYLVYAVVSVIIGVIVAALLERTPISGLATFAAAALILWSLDRWAITPWIERRATRKALADLVAVVNACGGFLLHIRLIQGTMYPMAKRCGIDLKPALTSLGGSAEHDDRDRFGARPRDEQS